MSQNAFDPKIAFAFQKGFASGQAAAEKLMKPFLEGVGALTEAVKELTAANNDILERVLGDEEEDEGEEWKNGEQTE